MRINLGKAISWTDAELAQLSEVTEKDIEAAAKWWRRYSPKRYRKLLNATPDDITANSQRESKHDNT